jgi:hypothetical protein
LDEFNWSFLIKEIVPIIRDSQMNHLPIFFSLDPDSLRWRVILMYQRNDEPSDAAWREDGSCTPSKTDSFHLWK